MPHTRTEAYVLAGLAALMVIHLVVRAVEVPITFEEATRYFALVLTAGIPADHALSVVWAKLLGPGLFMQRSFALLAFPLFAWYTFRLGAGIGDRLLRWCLWLALLIMPFAVETFALTGGHAPAMAFLLMGLYHVKAIGTGARHSALAALGFALAGLAAKAFWPLWALGLLAVVVITLHKGRSRDLLRAVPAVLLPAAWLWVTGTESDPAVDVPVLEELRTWVDLVLGTRAHTVLWLLITAVVAMGAVAFVRKGWSGPPAARTQLRLVAVMLGVWPAVLLLTGPVTDLRHDLLPWLPLFLLGWALAVEETARHARHRRWLALLLLIPPAVMVSGIHVGTTRASTDGAIPRSFQEAAQRMQHEAGEAVVVAGGQRQAPSWNFGALRSGGPLSLVQPEQERWSQADLLVVHRDAVQGLPGFREVEHGPSGLVLLAREPFAPRHAVNEVPIAWEASDVEFRELPLPTAEDLVGRDLAVELHGRLTLASPPKEGPFLVVEMNDADMGHLHYASTTLLPLLRGAGPGEKRLTFALPPVPPEAQRVAIYIWNPSRVALSAVDARLRLLERDHPAHQPAE